MCVVYRAVLARSTQNKEKEDGKSGMKTSVGEEEGKRKSKTSRQAEGGREREVVQINTVCGEREKSMRDKRDLSQVSRLREREK